MPNDEITVTRFLNARRDKVFKAWTQPELMARWFFPGDGWAATVESDLKVGGRYDLTMRDTEGGVHRQFGVYREISPVSRLVFTWTCPELAVEDSVVTVELIDHGVRTELRLTHALLDDPKVRRGHEEGWVGCLGSLEKLLEQPE